ncbi:MAG TPA: hypothetical protein PKZ45_09645 [Dysgonamonadaceae bacterium]|nr:hypothetical protein [Dysgonamonadaceae bacterium]
MSAQKSFRVITNGNFRRKIIVPLTVYRPFRAAIGRSMKWRPHHVAVKWSFGKMTSGVLPGKNWQVQKKYWRIYFGNGIISD